MNDLITNKPAELTSSSVGGGKKALLLALTVALALVAPRVAAAADLSVGDAAPEFTLKGTDGTQHKLSEYKGKQAVVLAWFPRAFTPG
jgi:peroxiredoxin Q/BCP